MKIKEFYDCHFQNEFDGLINKKNYRKHFFLKNEAFYRNQLEKGRGFRHLKLDYDPFDGFQMTLRKNTVFTSTGHPLNLTYSYIIEKSFYEDLARRFNLGKCQVFDLKDKLVETVNEYYFIYFYFNNLQDLEFEKCEYHFYIRNTGEYTGKYQESDLKILSKKEFQDYKLNFIGPPNCDLRIKKHIFNQSYYNYDVLVLNELELLSTNIKFSVDLMKYLKEQKVKCLLSNPIQIFYE